MRTSQDGIDMIKRFEGIRLRAYKALPSEKYYTIGYGHYGADVSADMSITLDEAEEILRHDLLKFETAVNELKIAQTQGQFDALVSFAYNCGVGNLKKLCNNRTVDKIAPAMLLYNKAGGRVLAGLQRRREAEYRLFTATQKSIHALAVEVIAGVWGNGEERRRRLTDAGHAYNAVQAEVNKLLREGG